MQERPTRPVNARTIHHIHIDTEILHNDPLNNVNVLMTTNNVINNHTRADKILLHVITT